MDKLQSNVYIEESLRTPVTAEYDVVVSGAGPAGITAAIVAARTGARVLLIESFGAPGGVWTISKVSWIIDSSDKFGILREMIERLKARSALGQRTRLDVDYAFDPEVMKLILEEMLEEAGVTVVYHTQVVATSVKDGAITHVVTESKSGRQAIKGKVFIDATGDGDLAAQAGCAYKFGRDETHETQPMTLEMIVTGIEEREVQDFIVYDSSYYQSKLNLLAALERAGVQSSYGKPTMFCIYHDLFLIQSNHEYGYRGTSAEDLTKATIHARKELFAIVDGLKSLGAPWTNMKIVATSEKIGVREGRRINGLYHVTEDDVRSGKRHHDAVCRVNFAVDVHSTNPERDGTSYGDEGVKSIPYDIPLRSLISADISNLMMAGRCISGDFISHAAYRVTGNAVTMGQAAGITAALAAKSATTPANVPWEQIDGILSEYRTQHPALTDNPALPENK